MAVEIRRQVGLGRLRNRARRGRSEDHPREIAFLALILVKRTHERVGDLGPSGEAIDDLLPDVAGAKLLDVLILGEAGILEKLDELDAVEIAGGVLEGRVAGNLLRQRLVGDAEAHAVGLVGQRRIRDQAAEHLLRHAEHLRLLGRDRLAELAAELAQRRIIVSRELAHRDLGIPDGGDDVGVEAGEEAGDAPDREAHDEERDKELRHPAAGSLAEPVEHVKPLVRSGALSPNSLKKRADNRQCGLPQQGCVAYM